MCNWAALAVIHQLPTLGGQICRRIVPAHIDCCCTTLLRAPVEGPSIWESKNIKECKQDNSPNVTPQMLAGSRVIANKTLLVSCGIICCRFFCIPCICSQILVLPGIGASGASAGFRSDGTEARYETSSDDGGVSGSWQQQQRRRPGWRNPNTTAP